MQHRPVGLALSLALLSAGCSTTLRVPGQEITKLRTLEQRPVARLSDGHDWVDLDADSHLEIVRDDGPRIETTAGAVRVHRDCLVVEGPKRWTVRRDAVTEVVVHGRERGDSGGDVLASVVTAALIVAVVSGAGVALEL